MDNAESGYEATIGLASASAETYNMDSFIDQLS